MRKQKTNKAQRHDAPLTKEEYAELNRLQLQVGDALSRSEYFDVITSVVGALRELVLFVELLGLSGIHHIPDLHAKAQKRVKQQERRNNWNARYHIGVARKAAANDNAAKPKRKKKKAA